MSSPVELTERILASIVGEGPAWFPELTAPLVAAAWRSRAARGLDRARYSTRAFLAASEGTAADAVEGLDRIGDGDAGPSPILEWPTPSVRMSYEPAGLEFLESSSSEWVVLALAEAVNCLADVPTLLASVRELVGSIHPLRCGSEDEDLSYSDPAVPFSIFVGVHKASGGEHRLRLAESVVHEAMHLQLSLIERHVPMVADAEATAHSPWRDEVRPVQGVLHGAYVFGCILGFYREVADRLPDRSPLLRFCGKRIATTRAEIREALAGEVRDPAFTAAGSLLVKRLLREAVAA